ncbi:PREDICTED: E3 ubiquitin-protein ligase HACE1-like [Amphimedon queenslandica]|uniref:E3 ubiquitin-protein ligase HACE1 n=2 Tax=Amphimedon queenslandica TaxID=400682 RepID=A0A1X7UMU8_AMPQE|nr:PREDICTED: E3 ubiquitin-protein ligase HACE1-like [Amphimedon queenslandica]|eukprot:XP_019853444.1 PREDICTED: E3 ubiquitin-protein ligase HACE1-like [Amphimedon queenslandica]
MAFVEFMKKALQRGRSVTLPPDPNEASYVLLPYVVQNQLKPVEQLITSSNFDVNHKFGRAQRTLLHSAANTGAIDTLSFLIKRGATINVIDRIGVTPLHLAARNGHKKCVQKLFDNGADISIHDNEGLTALHWLACNGRTELLFSILQRGEFVDVVDVHGHTALHVACQNGHYQCVLKLLEFKADFDKPSNDGRTPLFFACRHGQIKCLKLLLSMSASMAPDHNGVSPLEISAENGYKECVELILMKYPDQIDRLLLLSRDDKVPLDTMLSVMEYLCQCNVAIMIGLISRLANLASTAGMELLTVTSSYSDLMPQFLRYIKVLCALYPYYCSAVSQAPPSPLARQTSPTTRLRGSENPNDSRPRRAATLNLFSGRGGGGGHARTNSHGSPIDLFSEIQIERESMISASLGDVTSASSYPNNPMEQLDTVWASLASWFDLLQNEISKLPEVTPPIINEIDSPPTQVNEEACPTNGGDTSQLAAAIILSAPPRRRQVFLRNSNDGSGFVGGASSTVNKSLKRRTWHVDRVVRVIALEEEDEETSSLPSFARSTSSDNYHSSENQLKPLMEDIDQTPSIQEEVGEERGGAKSPDIVGVYADRLSAVTHAFSLCSKAMKKPAGKKSDSPDKFDEFVSKYESVLKVLLARCPKMIFVHFHFLLENNQLLQRFIHIVHAQPFEDRKKWFYENLYDGAEPNQQLTLVPQENEIIVDRENIFTTSCSKISEASVDQLKLSLAIRFEGEAGMGAGVHREWFNDLSSEILNPDYALFTQSADGATFQPNSHSDVNPDHLSYFKFAGRTMSLALYHRQLLNVYFTRSFYKHILGIPVSYRDVESIDPEYAKNLQWLLDNKIDEMDLGLTFLLETDVFGTTEIIELRQNGKDILVTDSNKKEYVQLVTEMRMTQAIGHQINAFTEGFYEIIPHHLISLFDEYELELLLSGLPDIDVKDWIKNTDYNGYSEEHPVIKWFWEVVEMMDKKTLAILLQFVTGSSRVPLGGFANLVGASGLTKFTISQLNYEPNRLPMASTCFNLLKLPEYPNKDILKERLNFALTCGTSLIDIT